jgi:predicted Zn-dependent protease
VPRTVKLEALRPYTDLFKGKSAEAAAEMQQLEKVKDRSQIERLAYAELARLAGQEQVFKESIDTGLTAFLEPSLLEKRRAEIEMQAGNTAGAIDFLQRSLAHEPDAATRLALLNALLSAGRRTQALQLLDEFNGSGLFAREISDLKTMLGLEDKDLLDLLGKLVDTALAEKLFYTAETYEYKRIDLARQLKIEISERLNEIDKQRSSGQPAKSPIRITDSIAN